ncbi:hypothetical protein D0439_09960 [Lysinibacillus fusiformis]|uniref:hypothetical protein n=1 Tax=Lysinibacillus fusiformis TaxID=28031 RepID=UPI0011BB1DAA|nr:hypothetical protein [Lysinibacillus fusiformis]QDZ98936.1 hypothetical protein D0439_09960 [Lysinibacillus fusiformis]WEA37525.1 hypothetical protein PWJ66_12630 [Lysinibacillus fusiformis]
MFITISILIISIIIVLIELPKLKKGGTKLTWIFSILLLMGTSLNIAISLEASIISPLDPIIYIFQPISDFLKENLLNKNN